MITQIEDHKSYATGRARLPFFGVAVSVLLESAAKEEIAFAQRQLALLNALPVETYEELCRHTIDYAADIVDYVGEYLGMYDKEDFEDEILPPIGKGDFSCLASLLGRWFKETEVADIVAEVKEKVQGGEPLSREKLLVLVGQAVLDLGYYEDNFHHVWPVVQKDLTRNPLGILRFVTPLAVRFERLTEKGREVLAANLEFNCDWEPEHGLQWSIVDRKGVWVSEFAGNVGLESTDYAYYNQDGNYCFHKVILS